MLYEGLHVSIGSQDEGHTPFLSETAVQRDITLANILQTRSNTITPYKALPILEFIGSGPLEKVGTGI